MEPNDIYREVRDDLIEYSQNFGEEVVRSRTELLFPAIFVASKRMSARAISRWLEENKGISFSAASVAKALRNQERYFKKIAERVQPIAEHVANSLGLDLVELLTEKTPRPSALVDEGGVSAVSGEHYFELRGYIQNAAQQLEEDWFQLDREIQYRALSYFDFTEPTDDEDED